MELLGGAGRAFRLSFKLVLEEDVEPAWEGAVGCCDDRARDDLLGDILGAESLRYVAW